MAFGNMRLERAVPKLNIHLVRCCGEDTSSSWVSRQSTGLGLGGGWLGGARSRDPVKIYRLSGSNWQRSGILVS